MCQSCATCPMAGSQHQHLHPWFCHFQQVQVVGFGLSVQLLHPLGHVRYQSRSEKDPSDFTGAKIATVGSFSFFELFLNQPFAPFQVQRCQGEVAHMTFLIQILLQYKYYNQIHTHFGQYAIHYSPFHAGSS